MPQTDDASFARNPNSFIIAAAQTEPSHLMHEQSNSMENQPLTARHPSALSRFIRGETFGLATTYWTLYILAGILFFLFGSVAVAGRNWPLYLGMLAGLIAWSFLLLLGVRSGYKGSDPGKALGRVAILFLLLNMSNVLATLSFI